MLVKKKRWYAPVFRFLSSVRLAVILLAVLIAGAAAGTIYESRFDAKVARAYVYEAPWFTIWLLLLVTNLIAAAFSRYPWKKHHTGFVMTHAGIVTLLIGAMVGRIWGVEGTMTLFEGKPPSNRLVLDRQEVRIEDNGQATTFPFELRHRHASAGHAVPLGVTSGDWKVDVTDYAELLQPVTSPQAATDGGAPVVQVKLWSMGQNLEQWLWPDDPDDNVLDLGLLAVECRRGSALEKKAAPGQKATVAATPTLPPGDRAVIYLADDGQLSYYIQNKQGNISRGVIEPGHPVATSWASWQMEVEQVMPSATPSTTFTPVAKHAKMSPRDRASCTEGIKVEISRGDEHYDQWLASGWEVELPTDHETLQASFGSKILPLPISLELKNFEVERNEGLDTPASFKSTVTVRDAVGGEATGSCSMNEPMNFPDVFWRRWTGLTYKVSQASWNPQNLAQSSVQILLDPGWLFKWTGSLLVCAGIFTMFYLRPPRDSAHP